MPKKPNTIIAKAEVAGYIPLERFYKWIRYMLLMVVILSVSTGIMTYWMGIKLGKEECATDGLKASMALTHKYNGIVNEEYNNLLNADSIDDYLMQ
jgi:hypothetical protein